MPVDDSVVSRLCVGKKMAETPVPDCSQTLSKKHELSTKNVPMASYTIDGDNLSIIIQYLITNFLT